MTSVVAESTRSDGENADRLEDRAEFGRALVRGGYEDVTILGLDEAAEILTEKRRELIDALRAGDYQSVRDLARGVGRDKGAVSRDLTVLAEHGVATLEDNGRAKRPVLRTGTIVVEPVAIIDG